MSTATLRFKPGFLDKATSRQIFLSPITWLAMRISGTPPSARASASPNLAQQIPRAPFSICFKAIWGVLWVFAWGLIPTPAPLSLRKSIILSMLASMMSRSTMRAGVSISVMGLPMISLRYSS